ncbi:MAG: hypothetical protein PVH19_13130 [Planctomycetia bacterium]
MNRGLFIFAKFANPNDRESFPKTARSTAAGRSSEIVSLGRRPCILPSGHSLPRFVSFWQDEHGKETNFF